MYFSTIKNKNTGAALRSSIRTYQIWKHSSMKIMTVMDYNPPNTLRILTDKKQIGEKGKFFTVVCQLLNDGANCKEWWMGLWKPSLHNPTVYSHTIISSGMNHQWILKQLLFPIISLLLISGIITFGWRTSYDFDPLKLLRLALWPSTWSASVSICFWEECTFCSCKDCVIQIFWVVTDCLVTCSINYWELILNL